MSAKFCKIRFFIFAGFLFTTTVVPFLSASLDSSPQITDGKQLINAMYEKYKGKWYDKLKIVQRVTYYRNGESDVLQKRRRAGEPDLDRVPGPAGEGAEQHRAI